MLFDLKGRRRRVVQATYLTLAVLMGGGLVLFGIGGEVSGGLFDAFSGRNQQSDTDDVFQERVDAAERKLRANPRDEAALRELARSNFQLASAQAAATTEFPDQAKDELDRAVRAWERYLALEPKRLDVSLAGVMLQAYGPGALERYDKAARTAEIVAEEAQTPQSYLALVQYASLAGNTRLADLAGQRAIDLAPRDQRRDVRQQVEAAKAQSALQQAQQQGQAQQGG